MTGDFPARRVLAAGIICGVAALALADVARAATPPTLAQVQRVAGAAYDRELRARYPRSGITTRCRGRTGHYWCSIHVRRRGVELFWQQTALRLRTGSVHTVLSPDLRGRFPVPRQPRACFYFTSEPTHD